MASTRNLCLLLTTLLFSSLSINAYAGPVCGDGLAEAPEECDEGNIAVSDTCTNTTTTQGGGECTDTFCGDSVPQGTNGKGGNEQCDDGNTSDGDGCSSTCQNEPDPPICGDGIVNGTDECDDGNTVDTDACTNACTLPACGDSIVNGTDECDDGNTTNNDICTNACTTPVCGDSIINGTDQCDDGNTIDDDACTNACTLPVPPTCGDGNVDTGEACDDGNTVDDDACTNACTLPVPPVCGDGIINGTDQCDDGNTVDNDACTNACALPICGDGIVNGGEACDGGDGCSSTCTIETPPPPALPVCGNGLVEDSEQCDDGNTTDGDSCSSSCTTETAPPPPLPVCGNGVVEDIEQCDDGNTTDGDSCSSSCTTETPTEPEGSSADRPLPGGGTVNITTGPNQTLSNVVVAPAVGGPSKVRFNFGMISYETTAPVGGTQTVQLTFSSALPENNLVVYKIDGSGNFKPLPSRAWNRVDIRTLELFLTDGDPATDLDGIVNGSIVDPVAVGDLKGTGGCAIGSSKSPFDPVWLLMLAVPAIGSLRRRTRARKEATARM